MGRPFGEVSLRARRQQLAGFDAAEDWVAVDRRQYFGRSRQSERSMPHVTLIRPDGQPIELDARLGRSLMRAAVDAGVEHIAADCGGSLTCATCHVVVADDWASRLPPPSADELDMLEMTAAERQPGSRLSCQIVLSDALDGLVVHLPARQY
jgi:2Fe-2S ferredoxin